MQIRNWTYDELSHIAADLGMRAIPASAGKGYTGVCLRTDSYAPKGTAPYRKASVSSIMRGDKKPRTCPGAVCFHGHWAFIHRLFQMRPETRVISSSGAFGGQLVYENMEDFHDKAAQLAESNIGSRMSYIRAEDACFCDEYREIKERMLRAAGVSHPTTYWESV